MSPKNTAWIPFLGAALLLLLTRWCWTFSFQTNDDELMSWLFQGGMGELDSLSWGPYLVFIGPAIAKASQVLPAWPWYGLFFYAYLVVVLGVLLHNTWGALVPKWGWPSSLLLVLLAAWCSYPEHAIGFNFTRAAILGAGAALLGEALARPGRPNSRFWRIVLLMLAIFIRPEAAFLGALLGASWGLAIGALQAGMFNRSRMAWTSLGLALTLLVPTVLPNTGSMKDKARLEGHVHVIDYGWVKKGWAKDARDSLLEEGLAYRFDTDPAVYDAVFFARISWPSVFQTDRWRDFPDPAHWQAVRASFSPDTFPSLRSSFFLLLLLLVWIFVGRSKMSPWSPFLYAMGLILLTGAGLVWMAYFMKLPNRVLQPVITLTLMGLLGMMASPGIRSPNGRTLLISAIAFFAFGIMPMHALRTRQSDAIENNRMQVQNFWAAYPAEWWNKPTLIGIPIYMQALVDGDPLRPYQLPTDPVLIDGWVARLPAYQQALAERTGSSNYGAQWVYWAHAGGMLISTAQHAAFFQAYLAQEYGLQLKLESIWERQDIHGFRIGMIDMGGTDGF